MNSESSNLPSFLRDLTCNIGGRTLQMFPSPSDEGFSYIGLSPSDEGDPGIYVDLNREVAEVRCSQAVTRYVDGHEETYCAWGDDSPEIVDAPPFQDWLRSELLQEIDRLLAWHIEGTLGETPVSDPSEVFAQLCREFEALPPLPLSHMHNRGFIFDLLATTGRVRERGALVAEDLAALDAFARGWTSTTLPFNKTLATGALDVALTLLPTTPEGLADLIDERVDALLADFEDSGQTPCPRALFECAQRIAAAPEAIRKVAHPRILRLCTTSKLAHICLSTLVHYPNEAHAYIEHGLSLDPQDVSLLTTAETAYLQDPSRSAELHSVRAKLSDLGVTLNDTNQVDTQAWINRYTHLANDYQHYDPQTDPSKTLRELLDLETRLNQYWMSTLPTNASMARATVEQDLVSQNRFLSAGSASAVGWLRNQKRYQEVVDYMMPLAQEAELCSLRHKTNPWGFEAFLGNGLSCFLDSQQPNHIDQAVALIDALEEMVKEWHYDHAVYAFGCVFARANQVERALVYVRMLLERGGCIEDVTCDTDFLNVHTHPDFEALRSEYYASL